MFILTMCVVVLVVVGLYQVLSLLQRKRFLDRHDGLRELFKEYGPPVHGEHVRFDGFQEILAGSSQSATAFALAQAVNQGQFVAKWMIRNPRYAEDFRTLNAAILR